MRKALIVAAAAAIAVAGTLSEPARAGDRGGAVAAGVLGGLALAPSSARLRPNRAITAAAAYYAEPEPVYVAPPAPRCYWTRGEPVWDGYRGMWVRPRLQVCD